MKKKPEEPVPEKVKRKPIKHGHSEGKSEKHLTIVKNVQKEGGKLRDFWG